MKVEMLRGNEPLALGGVEVNVSHDGRHITHEIACATVDPPEESQAALADAFVDKRRVRLRYTFPAGDIYSYSGYVAGVERTPDGRIFRITQFGKGRLV